MASFFNIKGSSVSGGQETTELLGPEASRSALTSILLTNVHASADATVTLFIENDPDDTASETYNIIHTIAIPADSSLLLDRNTIVDVPTSFGLYITVGTSDTVDVIIN